MTLSRLFSSCCFSHADDPLIVMRGKQMRWECRRCQTDLGEVLAGQHYKARKPVKLRKRRSASVLTLTRKQA